MNKNLIYAAIACIIIILFGVSAYLLGQNQKLISEKSKTEATPTPKIPISPTLEPASPSASLDGPTIILPSQDASQLKKRIVDPYIDYFKDTHKNDVLVSFNISVNTGAGQDQYPYKAQAITANGINEGFLISQTGGPASPGSLGGHIDWWYPDCLVKCKFTKSFSSKYPEIVKKVQN